MGFPVLSSSQIDHYNDKGDTSSRTVESVVVSVNIKNIIFVDSVVNQGRSIRRCLASLEMSKRIRIHILTAVLQQEASVKLPKEYPRVKFLALGVSENKYTGRGGQEPAVCVGHST
jgi:hypoxanthine phosphoribosyltransferase